MVLSIFSCLWCLIIFWSTNVYTTTGRSVQPYQRQTQYINSPPAVHSCNFTQKTYSVNCLLSHYNSRFIVRKMNECIMVIHGKLDHAKLPQEIVLFYKLFSRSKPGPLCDYIMFRSFKSTNSQSLIIVDLKTCLLITNELTINSPGASEELLP